jgi:hypothetical protein
MSSAQPVTDHAKIKKWVEKHNGRPAAVKGTGKGSDPGVLRIDFDKPEDGLEEIEWDTWFKWFDKNNLALLMGDDSRFNKLVDRDKAH